MHTRRAILFMVLSTLAFTGMNGLLKYLTGYNGYQLVFFRSVGSLFFTFGFLLQRGIPILGTHRKLLVLRGLMGAASMLLFFIAVHYLPIGSAVALRYIAPIFATLFAMVLLGERIHPLQWLFFIMAFMGVLVIKGLDDSIPLIGLILILLSAIFGGLVFIIIRKLGTKEHPVVIVNYFMCIAALVGGVGCLFNWKTPSTTDTVLLLSLGVFGYFGQLFMTKALQMVETNLIAPIKYIEVIFVVIVGVTFLDERYSLWSLAGMLLIILSLSLNIWYKNKLMRREGRN
jgi:drug/metabolite transporter (DMT)-like permease